MSLQSTEQYRDIIRRCKEIFEKKTKDYGTSWRIMRLPSVTDQIYIKALRIRSVQEKENQYIDDSISDEFVGIVNYCVIALLQVQLTNDERVELGVEELNPAYDKIVEKTYNLFQQKNHDYGEAWRNMRVSSITDIILMRILRIKQIEDNEGKTLASEGVAPNYQDMLNYAVFALIKLNEEKQS